MTERWTLHPRIMPNEAISSWIKRIADKHLRNIPYFIQESNRYNYSVLSILSKKNTQLIRFLSQNTGIEIDEIDKNTLHYFAENLPELEGSLDFSQKNSYSFILGGRGRGIRGIF